MRNLIILLAVLLHFCAFLWSCFRSGKEPDSEIQGPRAKFIFANAFVDKEDKVNLTWQTSSSNQKVDIYASSDRHQFGKRNHQLATDKTSAVLERKSINTSTYLHLVLPGQDTISLATSSFAKRSR